MIWSISDSKTFKRCQRQWFYKSVLASPRARDSERHHLYLLSKLQSISAWRGQVVDSTISDVLIPAIRNRRPITLEQLKRSAHFLFDQQLACGLSHRLFTPGFSPSKLGPAFAAFHCMEYGAEPTSDEITRARDEVVQALTNLFRLTEIKDLIKTASHLVPQRPLVFPHAGVSVRAVPDLILFFASAPPVIVDWKVHFFGVDEAWLQLATYAMALTRCKPHRDFPELSSWTATQIQLAEVQLLKNHVRRYNLTPEELDRAEAHIADSATEMALAASDRQGQELTAEDFGVARYEGACQTCNFRKVCWGGNA